MVELVCDGGCCIGPRNAIIQDIVRCLDVERLLDFSVRSSPKVQKYKPRYEQVNGEV